MNDQIKPQITLNFRTYIHLDYLITHNYGRIQRTLAIIEADLKRMEELAEEHVNTGIFNAEQEAAFKALADSARNANLVFYNAVHENFLGSTKLSMDRAMDTLP